MPDMTANLRVARSLIVATILLFFAIGSAGVSQAQMIPGAPAPQAEPEAEPTPPSPNDIRELMRLLADPSVVVWLRSQGEQMLDGESGFDDSESFQEELAERVERTRLRLTSLAISWRNLPAAPAFLSEAWQEQVTSDQTLRSIIYVVIFLVIGSGLEWLYRQYTLQPMLRLELNKSTSLSHRLNAAVLRAVLVFGGLLIFSIGTIGAFLSFTWPSFVENIVLNLLTIVITIRVASTVSMFFLAPRVPELRLVPLSSALARPLHYWLVLIASIGVISFSVTDVFVHLAGNTDALGATLAVAVGTGAALAVAVILAVWHLSWIIGKRSLREDAIVSSRRLKFWPGYLTLLTAATWCLWLLSATELMWTVIILGLLFPVTRLLNGWIDYFFDEAEAKHEPEQQENFEPEAVEAPPIVPVAEAAPADAGVGADGPLEQTAVAEPGSITPVEPTPAEPEGAEEEEEAVSALELYRPVARRFVRFVAVLCAIFALLAAWGGNIFSLSESQTFSGRFVGILADIITVLLIADLIWIWAKSAIDRRLANYVPPQGSEAPGPEARMATLLPILRVTLMVTLIAIVIMTILASMGINVGPLLAGAGVIGIAVGFGAQALVKDIVSGIFFLIDDAFRIGEYIEVGSLRGTVESMSIRSLRVRHHLGAIHTIPFGELTSLTNYSRDWVIMRLEFRVPFDTDLKLVKKIVKKIGAELQENEVYGDGIIQTLKSQGVRRMEEFNMVVGVKFMAKPGSQWLVRRDAYQKLRDAFDANGINFAQRNVTVEVLGDQPLGEEAKKAIAGAAQNAVDSAAGPPQPVPDEP
ncbi:MAG: mechanosensitive ion channel [Alphaproteobacteria bacterium]|nr:mechanosensitive ion channel [Alphaproteobacteria bacterium]